MVDQVVSWKTILGFGCLIVSESGQIHTYFQCWKWLDRLTLKKLFAKAQKQRVAITCQKAPAVEEPAVETTGETGETQVWLLFYLQCERL